MKALSASRLRVSYANRLILRDIDLHLAPGDTCALLGANGSGKSTLLRALAGLVKPESGSVAIGGRDLYRQRAAALAQVGFVAQRFGLYEDLTVEENLRFYGRCYELWGEPLRRAIDASIERFDLAAWRRNTAGTLSYGWKQRLAAAAATLHSPSLLLLDEATTGLDVDGRAAMWEILTGYANAGTAVLLITHHDDDAARCDRVARLRDGAVQ
jgi:ABC-2 type transport system ATP-binding protein